MTIVLSTGWWAEAAMRLALVIFAVFNMRFSIKPTIEFARGKHIAPTIFYASIFFGNVAYLIFGVMFFFGLVSYAWTLLLLSLRLVSAALISFAYRNALDQRLVDFYSLHDALPQALAIADLARVDPQAADALAGEAARIYAVKVAGSSVRAG